MSTAPIWMRITPYRACELCMHRQAATAALCACPATQQDSEPLPVALARAPGAACGPDALHLDMASWQ